MPAPNRVWCRALLAFAALVRAHEAAHEAAGHEAGHAAHQPEADVAVALMLMMGVIFIMTTFYLVNAKDEDLRKASWSVISLTISIFAAVLLFMSGNMCIKWGILGMGVEGEGPAWGGELGKIVGSFVQAILYLLILQVVLAFTSGAVSLKELLGKNDKEEKGRPAELRMLSPAEGDSDDDEDAEGGTCCCSGPEPTSTERAKEYWIKQIDCKELSEYLLNLKPESLALAMGHYMPEEEDNYEKALLVFDSARSAAGEVNDRTPAIIQWKSVQTVRLLKVMSSTLQMNCWAMLFAHLAGFAWINFMGTLQYAMAVWTYELIKAKPPSGEAEAAETAERRLHGEHIVIPEFDIATLSSCVLTCVIAACVMKVLFNICARVRDKIETADDGRQDEFELLWQRGTSETEDDAFGLTMSFLIMNCIRFAITGVLPNEEGFVPHSIILEMKYNIPQVIQLLLVGVLVISAQLLLVKLTKSERTQDQIKVICRMCFAWSLFFGMYWTICRVLGMVFIHTYATSAFVILCSMATLTSYAMIIIADKLADSYSEEGVEGGSKIETLMRQVIMALGILIGFSFEKCFDHALMGIAHKWSELKTDNDVLDMIFDIPRPVMEFLLAIFVSCIVVPAWAWYILPKILLAETRERINELNQKKDDEFEDDADEVTGTTVE